MPTRSWHMQIYTDKFIDISCLCIKFVFNSTITKQVVEGNPSGLYVIVLGPAGCGNLLFWWKHAAGRLFPYSSSAGSGA